MTDMQSEIMALRGPLLVLGAAGFVGANLFQHLNRLRDDVYAVVRDEKTWRLRDVEDDKVIACDLNDHAAAKHLVRTINPQTVFDCVAYGAYSFEDKSELIYRTNFTSLVNVIELLREGQVAAFVHAGTSSEYGLNCTAPDEGGPCEPNSHYAVSKVAAASYLRWVGKQKAFPCVNLRLYSVYGPLEDTSRLIPNIVRLAQQGHLPPLVDPRTSRDFVHVDDACAAFVTAAVRMRPDLYGEDFNIGSGTRTTIAELATLVRQQFGVQEEPNFGSMEGRSWDLADWYADPGKSLRLLGWKTRISLEEGLASTADWIRTLSESEVAVATKKNAGTKRSLAAVIACYKDAQAIPVMHERLTATFRKLGIDYEIIFVNDGSPDDSAEVIRAITERDSHVLGITHSRNFGSQMAFRSGMELSTKDGVVLLDGDLQDPPELIERFYEQWIAGHDVIYGRRVKRDMPWHWGLMYKAFYRVFAAFSYVDIPLDAGDFSLMDKRVVSWLLTFPERDLFMRGLRAYVGFRQTGVDYVRPERMFGVSTNNLLKNIDWAKKGIFSFSNTPLTILTAVGILLLAASLLLAAIVVVLRILVPDIAPRGVTTLLIAILVFGSLNLFAVGLIGEYVAKIMTEVKRRPPLIRSAFVRGGRVTELLPDGKEAKR